MPIGPIIGDSGDPVRNPTGGLSGTGGGGFTGGGGPPGAGALAGSGPGFAGFGAAGFGVDGPGVAPNKPRRFYTMADQVSQRRATGASVSTAPSAPGYAMGGQIPPGPTDTVPAMLTPGEFVVRRDAAQQPQNAAMLEQMNGGGGMDDEMGGGMSGGMGGGMGAPPGLSREALVELLQVLLGGQGQQDCPMCGGQGCGMCNGGKVGYSIGGWVSRNKWAIPLAALAAAAAAPLVLGGGAAAGATGAGAAGAGAAGGATAIGSGTAAGLSVGPMATVPAVAHTANTGLLGTLTRAYQMHPGIGQAGGALMAAGQQYQDGQAQQRDLRAQEDQQAVNDYLMARSRSEQPQGYFQGGTVGAANRLFPSWGAPPRTGASPFGNTQSGAALTANWANPAQMSSMAESGARDANAYASGVFRNAQLEGADPGAQAAYRLRALASAGRGSSEAMSKYRTDNAAAEQQRLFDLYKQSKDFEYQAKLKGMRP